MPPVSIILAWKDAEYRRNLSNGEKSQLADHSTGLTNLLDEDQESGAAALDTDHNVSWVVEFRAQ